MKLRALPLVLLVGSAFLAPLTAGGESVTSIPEELRPEVEQAKALFEKGDYQGARMVYQSLDAKLPKSVYILSNLAITQIRSDDLDGAADTVERLLTAKPRDDYGLTLRGMIQFRRDQLDAARRSFEQAVELNAKNEVAQQYLGVIASLQGMEEKAKAQFGIARQLDPTLPEPSAIVAPPSGKLERKWWIGDYLTPLEKSRLRIPDDKPL